MNSNSNKITIRGVSTTVLSKLDTLAAERHTSRNQLLCSLLENCLADMQFLRKRKSLCRLGSLML